MVRESNARPMQITDKGIENGVFHLEVMFTLPSRFPWVCFFVKEASLISRHRSSLNVQGRTDLRLKSVQSNKIV